jgi:hypothetical protein
MYYNGTDKGAFASAVGAYTAKITDFWDGTNYYAVYANGATRPYYITTGGVLTQIADVDCPTTAYSPYCVYMDGALFIAKGNTIYNSEFGSITNWPGYFRTKEQYPDQIIALAKHHNSIVAFGASSTEFFFNAGYSGTSPLNRQESYSSKISVVPLLGGVHAEMDDKIFFIGGHGNTDCYILENFRFRKVSTPFISRLINFYINRLIPGGFGIPVINVTAIKIAGHSLFLVVPNDNPPSSGTFLGNEEITPTLVYDVEEDMWSCWSARNIYNNGLTSVDFGNADGTIHVNPFPLMKIQRDPGGYGHFGMHYGSTEGASGIFRVFQKPGGLLGASDNSTFYDYDDSDFPIDFCIRTPEIDFGNRKQKHLKKIFVNNFVDDWRQQNSTTINLYVFTSNNKQGVGNTYPNPIVLSSNDDTWATNLSTGRKFICEVHWSGSTITSVDEFEFHYNEGEQ